MTLNSYLPKYWVRGLFHHAQLMQCSRWSQDLCVLGELSTPQQLVCPSSSALIRAWLLLAGHQGVPDCDPWHWV